MGLSSKKTKTTESSTSSTTPTNPQWVTDAAKGFTDQVTGLLDDDPQQYVAGVNPLQTQAAAGAASLGGWKSGLDAATQAATAAGGPTQQVTGSSLLQGLDDYMSPYTQDVVDTTLNDFDVDSGRTRAAQAASAAASGAFGGSRFGVREAQTEGELARARATAEATLRDQAFTTGAGLSNSDAARRQDADLANQAAQAGDLDRQTTISGLMSQIANLTGSNARDDVTTQAGMGDALRAIEEEQKQAPLGLLGSVGNLLGEGQFGLFNGSDATGTGTGTVTSSPSLLSQIGKGVSTAAAAASLFSDMRLKTNIETLGRDERGRRWASYRYAWEPVDARHVGVMAQEIEATDPEAVTVGPMGFLMVDYNKLEGSTWQAS